MTRIPAGAGSETLAAMTVTSAPRRAAAAANDSPIRPEERLPMYLTGSIGSRVPPAVTSTRTPAQPRLRAGASSRSQAATSSPGSDIRPDPYSPCDASSPVLGPTVSTPRPAAA